MVGHHGAATPAAGRFNNASFECALKSLSDDESVAGVVAGMNARVKLLRDRSGGYFSVDDACDVIGSFYYNASLNGVMLLSCYPGSYFTLKKVNKQFRVEALDDTFWKKARELKALEGEHAVLKRKNENLQGDIDDLRTDNDSLVAYHRLLEAQNKDLIARIAALEEQNKALAQADATNKTLAANVDGMEAQLSQLADENEELPARVDASDREKQATVDTLIQAETKITFLATDITNLKEAIDILNSEKTALETNVTSRTTDNTSLKEEIAILKTDTRDLETNVASLATDNTRLKEETDILKSEKIAMDTMTENLTTSLKETIDENKDFKACIKNLNTYLNEVKADRDTLKVQLDDTVAEKSGLQERVNGLEEQNDSLEDRNKSLEEQNTELTAAFDEAKADILAIGSMVNRSLARRAHSE